MVVVNKADGDLAPRPGGRWPTTATPSTCCGPSTPAGRCRCWRPQRSRAPASTRRGPRSSGWRPTCGPGRLDRAALGPGGGLAVGRDARAAGRRLPPRRAGGQAPRRGRGRGAGGAPLPHHRGPRPAGRPRPRAESDEDGATRTGPRERPPRAECHGERRRPRRRRGGAGRRLAWGAPRRAGRLGPAAWPDGGGPPGPTPEVPPWLPLPTGTDGRPLPRVPVAGPDVRGPGARRAGAVPGCGSNGRDRFLHWCLRAAGAASARSCGSSSAAPGWARPTGPP